MDMLVQFSAHLHASPAALVGWLHTLVNIYTVELAWPLAMIVGPHTFAAAEPTAHETLALYVVDKRIPHDIPARQVALALTYVPLRPPVIGLDLRVWPLFPATLDALKFQFSDFFTQASPVFSSVASLHFTIGAQPLACNRWLLEQLADPRFTDAKAAKLLYPAWLEQYRALRGEYPVDPRRGFRALITKYFRRRP